MIGIEPDRRIVIPNREIEAPLGQVGVATIVDSTRVARTDTDRLVEILNRAVVLVLVVIGGAAIDEGLEVVGLKAKRFVKILDRTIDLAPRMMITKATVAEGHGTRSQRHPTLRNDYVAAVDGEVAYLRCVAPPQRKRILRCRRSGAQDRQ